MEIRKEKSSFSLKRQNSGDLFKNDLHDQSTSTPICTNSRSEDEESPYYPYSTQEMREDVDVLWNYNSPKSKPKRIRQSRRLNLARSPKVPLRRHNSNNNEQIKQDFCKLREELEALKAEIAKPDHEESLILSPREEEAFREINFEQTDDEPDIFAKDFLEDPFDDGMDDQLMLLSQRVESEIEKKGVVHASGHLKTVSKPGLQENSDIFNDSFDNVLSQVKMEDFDLLNRVEHNKQNVFPRSVSEEHLQYNYVQKQSVSRKVEWHRTQSFERFNNTQLSQEQLNEIERKRLEAKAKLYGKQKKETVLTTLAEEPIDSSPVCSPDEIERKRLQALAKLEAKRQKEFIEKKKQEALKRREESRRKNAYYVKSSLSTKL